MAIKYKMTMDEYRKSDGIGSSLLKKIITHNPEEFLASKEKKALDIETKQTTLGTAIHTAILERHIFEENYALQLQDWGPRNKGEGFKKWKDFKEKNKNKKCLTLEEAILIDKILKKIEKNKHLKSIIKSGHREISVFSKMNGYTLKGRPDWLDENKILWDIKTTSKNMSKTGLANTIFKMGYHFQLAHYFKILMKEGIEIGGVGWIFISTNSDAIHIAILKASEELLKAGIKDHDHAISILENCLEKDYWPGYSEEIEEIGLPDFAKKYY